MTLRNGGDWLQSAIEAVMNTCMTGQAQRRAIYAAMAVDRQAWSTSEVQPSSALYEMEKILALGAKWAGLPSVSVGDMTRRLRADGLTALAKRVQKLSKVRNVAAHPDVSLMTELLEALDKPVGVVEHEIEHVCCGHELPSELASAVASESCEQDEDEDEESESLEVEDEEFETTEDVSVDAAVAVPSGPVFAAPPPEESFVLLYEELLGDLTPEIDAVLSPHHLRGLSVDVSWSKNSKQIEVLIYYCGYSDREGHCDAKLRIKALLLREAEARNLCPCRTFVAQKN
jgi:hypothetical protein